MTKVQVFHGAVSQYQTDYLFFSLSLSFGLATWYLEIIVICICRQWFSILDKSIFIDIKIILPMLFERRNIPCIPSHWYCLRLWFSVYLVESNLVPLATLFFFYLVMKGFYLILHRLYKCYTENWQFCKTSYLRGN